MHTVHNFIAYDFTFILKLTTVFMSVTRKIFIGAFKKRKH